MQSNDLETCGKKCVAFASIIKSSFDSGTDVFNIWCTFCISDLQSFTITCCIKFLRDASMQKSSLPLLWYALSFVTIFSEGPY